MQIDIQYDIRRVYEKWVGYGMHTWVMMGDTQETPVKCGGSPTMVCSE